jgi:hypothetical protein
MTEEKKYRAARVNEPKKVVKFLIKHLDFFDDPIAKKGDTDKNGIRISSKFGDDYLLVQGSAASIAGQNAGETITFNTDNCLRDYHQLKSIGVKIEQIPRYTNRGLEVIFSDDYGNHYLLLEKRDYSET